MTYRIEFLSEGKWETLPGVGPFDTEQEAQQEADDRAGVFYRAYEVSDRYRVVPDAEPQAGGPYRIEYQKPAGYWVSLSAPYGTRAEAQEEISKRAARLGNQPCRYRVVPDRDLPAETPRDMAEEEPNPIAALRRAAELLDQASHPYSARQARELADSLEVPAVPESWPPQAGDLWEGRDARLWFMTQDTLVSTSAQHAAPGEWLAQDAGKAPRLRFRES